jgi:predicted metal-dependent hydrolase
MQNFKISILTVGSQEILVQFKPIKNLHLSVMPPNGTVKVSAPLRMSESEIQQMLAIKLPWIKKQQKKFHDQARQTPREYVSGETHYVFGQPYRLEVIEKNEAAKVYIGGKSKLVLQIRPNTATEKRAEILNGWYRAELRTVLEKMIAGWQGKIGKSFTGWKIMEMKTRWGTCNQKKQTALFNLELAKKPLPCVEYVVVHELVHLIERKHNDRFKAILDQHLPKWRSLKEELNRFILDCWK